jgi:hypothetical protein
MTDGLALQLHPDNVDVHVVAPDICALGILLWASADIICISLAKTRPVRNAVEVTFRHCADASHLWQVEVQRIVLG